MEYPRKRVYLLDEQRRPAMKALCEELGVIWMTRPDNRGAKAGNINHALARTDGELVAVFDADQVPTRTFLQLTVGPFLRDPQLALVQTPHHFCNPDPFERNLHVEGVIPAEQLMFYHVIQVGNDFWNSAFFCGSSAVLRRSALLDVGGIAQETVTEDAHTALKMHARGWRSAYVAIPQAAGLATERYAFYVTQRIRWARGMVQILRMDNPLFKKGLGAAQRINYFNAAAHFLFGIPRMFYLLAPPAWILFGVHPLEAGAVQIASYALPHVFLSVVGGATIARGARHSFWAEVYETAIAPYLAIVTLVTVASPRHGKFKVTAKGTRLDTARFDWQRALPNLFVAGIVGAALVASPLRLAMYPAERGTTLLAAFWNLYNAVILGAAVAVALDRSQRRGSYRVRRCARAVLSAGGQQVRGHTLDLGEEGARVRLDGPAPAPGAARLRLEGDDGAVFEAAVDIVDVQLGEGAHVARCRFRALSPTQLRGLIEQMFSPANAWVHHPAPPDDPLRSWAEVLRAPWVALRRRTAAGGAQGNA
jgi:cellulose synthase (UDP-forming)